jgi:hypothetical protein
MNVKQVFASAHFQVMWDSGTHIVRVTRLPEQFVSVTEMERAHEEMCTALDLLGRWRSSVLVDLRGAPGRNDPVFERLMKKLRPRIFADFRRCAVLVQTAVGSLQVSRYARQDGIKLLVSSDEAALIEYLRRLPTEDSSQFALKLAV